MNSKALDLGKTKNGCTCTVANNFEPFHSNYYCLLILTNDDEHIEPSKRSFPQNQEHSLGKYIILGNLLSKSQLTLKIGCLLIEGNQPQAWYQISVSFSFVSTTLKKLMLRTSISHLSVGHNGTEAFNPQVICLRRIYSN